MQGTILVIDGVSTNRIMLKVQLSSAYYHVVQAEGLAGLLPLIRRCRPDLILTAMHLPDGDARDVRAILAGDGRMADLPVIAIAAENDCQSRLSALAGGVDEVLNQPLNDVLLQARIRNLIRAHDTVTDLRLQGGQSDLPGLAETQLDFVTAPAPARVALVARNITTAKLWRDRVRSKTGHRLSVHRLDGIKTLMSDQVPDAVVIELDESPDGAGLRLLTDLRARSATRQTVTLGVPAGSNPGLAAEALDLGAHDVLHGGFDADELALRLNAQLRHSRRCKSLRDSMRDGLRASVMDSMTGLHNRRYALPRLNRMIRNCADVGDSLALMLVDLDHFKQVNDRHGHLAGDAVLIETARRLRSQTGPGDLLARLGGEEFLIALPSVTAEQAQKVAQQVCGRINGTPFAVPGLAEPIPVTTSIGVVVGPCDDGSAGLSDSACAEALIARADRALYQAKHAGRNQVTLSRVAA